MKNFSWYIIISSLLHYIVSAQRSDYAYNSGVLSVLYENGDWQVRQLGLKHVSYL